MAVRLRGRAAGLLVAMRTAAKTIQLQLMSYLKRKKAVVELLEVLEYVAEPDSAPCGLHWDESRWTGVQVTGQTEEIF